MLPRGQAGRAPASRARRARAPRERAAARERGDPDVSDFIDRYLVAGCRAFARRVEPVAGEAIDLIHAAGGAAVWAHPFWDIDDPQAVLSTLLRLRLCGLDGVEAFYVTHDEAQTALLASTAARDHLLVTGSSDFHGPEHRFFSRFQAFDLHGDEPRLGPLLDPAAVG